MGQLAMFDRGPPTIDHQFQRIQRHDLGRGAWLEHQATWLSGHGELFEMLANGMRWRASRREMYDRVVEVPRLVASTPDDGDGHPALERAASLLSARYKRPLRRVAMALYRHGHDSVAWHADRIENREDSVIAIVAVGSPRTFRVRPAEGGKSQSFRLGWGDLLVMGGTFQQHFEHAVPKEDAAAARISIQFREVRPPDRLAMEQERFGAASLEWWPAKASS